MIHAGYFLLLSALLHVVGVAMAGFSSDVRILLLPPLLYFVLFFGLQRGIIWVALIALVCMIIGGIGSFLAMSDGWPVPGWIFLSIGLVDFAAALLLARAVWGHAQT